MLIRKQVLDGIRAGTVELAFRRWKRPTVEAGGTLRTRSGVLSSAVAAGEGVSREARAAPALRRRA